MFPQRQSGKTDPDNFRIPGMFPDKIERNQNTMIQLRITLPKYTRRNPSVLRKCGNFPHQFLIIGL